MSRAALRFNYGMLRVDLLVMTAEVEAKLDDFQRFRGVASDGNLLSITSEHFRKTSPNRL